MLLVQIVLSILFVNVILKFGLGLHQHLHVASGHQLSHFDAQSVHEKEEDDELLKMALEEHSRREEEILARDLNQPCFGTCEFVSSDYCFELLLFPC